MKRWGWMVSKRGQASEALDRLAMALGEAAMLRCAAVYGAYRVTAIAALQDEARSNLPEELRTALVQCHAARRSGGMAPADVRQLLDGQCEALASTAYDRVDLEAAWVAIDGTGLGSMARRLFGDKALDRAAARDRKRGWAKVERELRTDERLPAAFRANPAQHFYSLQQMLAEKRRQRWREECDREPDAFELAA